VAEALFFAVAMIPVSLVPWRLGMAGLAYAILAGCTGAALPCVHDPVCRNPADRRMKRKAAMLARDLLKVSVLYLPLLFTTLMVCSIGKQ